MLLHSIIIPVYNTSQYLKECIESILCQNDILFELLLIDDGSTDDSGKFAMNIHKRHKSKMLSYSKRRCKQG